MGRCAEVLGEDIEILINRNGELVNDEAGNLKEIKIQPMKSSLATRQILIDVMIQNLIGNGQTDNSSVMVVFVSKNVRDAMELDRELNNANFHNLTKCDRVVGYIRHLR